MSSSLMRGGLICGAIEAVGYIGSDQNRRILKRSFT